MDYALLNAVIAALLADATISTGVGGRIGPEKQIDPKWAFPRCMVGIPTPPRDIWLGGTMRDREIPISVMFATTSVTSPTAYKDILALDARVDIVVPQIALAGLKMIRRTQGISPPNQIDDLTEYIVAGGEYLALMQVA